MAASGIGTGRSPISRSRTIIEAGKDMASQMAPLDFAMLDQTTLRLRGPTNCGFHLFGATLAPARCAFPDHATEHQTVTGSYDGSYLRTGIRCVRH